MNGKKRRVGSGHVVTEMLETKVAAAKVKGSTNVASADPQPLTNGKATQHVADAYEALRRSADAFKTSPDHSRDLGPEVTLHLAAVASAPSVRAALELAQQTPGLAAYLRKNGPQPLVVERCLAQEGAIVAEGSLHNWAIDTALIAMPDLPGKVRFRLTQTEQWIGSTRGGHCFQYWLPSGGRGRLPSPAASSVLALVDHSLAEMTHITQQQIASGLSCVLSSDQPARLAAAESTSAETSASRSR